MCRGGRPDLELLFGSPCSRDAGSFREQRGSESPTGGGGPAFVGGGPGAHRPASAGRPPYSAFCVSCGQLSVWDGVLVSWGWTVCGSRVQGPQSPGSITAAICASLQDSPPGPDTMPSAQGLIWEDWKLTCYYCSRKMFFAANVCVVGMAM